MRVLTKCVKNETVLNMPSLSYVNVCVCGGEPAQTWPIEEPVLMRKQREVDSFVLSETLLQM